MASNYFHYSPTGGTGDTLVSVEAYTTNSGRTDKNAVITLSGGPMTTDVNVRQNCKPYFVQSTPFTIPATGGTIYFTVHTHYDVQFMNKPEWLTISYNSTSYQPNTRISSAVTDGRTFALTAEPNTGSARHVENSFNMAHYIGETLYSGVSSVTYFIVSQSSIDSFSSLTINLELQQPALVGDYVVCAKTYSYEDYLGELMFEFDDGISEMDENTTVKVRGNATTYLNFDITPFFTGSDIPDEEEVPDPDVTLTLSYGSYTETQNGSLQETFVFSNIPYVHDADEWVFLNLRVS